MRKSTDTNEPRSGRIVYAVLAQVRQGVAHDFLAVYSTASLAREFVDAQDVQLRQCLVVWEVEVDRHPSDPYWTAPHVDSPT